ncbi:MAG: hypothetical protein ABRQ37_18745 [Candidatus Eremiobacterota bacterium]
MDETFTIKEVARLYNFNINTLYKKIQHGKIKVVYEIQNGKKIQKVKKSDIEMFLGIIQSKDSNTIQYNTITIDTIRDTISDIINTKTTEITKSMEDFSLYKLGKIETEYKFLQEKYETVLQENTILQNKIKALPDKEAYNNIQFDNIALKEQTIEINKKLQEKEQELKELENKQQKELKQEEEEKARLRAQAEAEKTEMEVRLKAETEKAQKQKDETELRLQEKEKALKEQEARLKAADEEAQRQKEELEAKLKVEEEEKARAKSEAEEAQKQLQALPAPAESIQQILLDNANNIKELTKEKETFQSVFKEHEATIKEKERAMKELDELHRQELEALKKKAEEEKARLKVEADAEKEKEKQEIAEAWKKELELARKPWWKWW